MTLEPQVGQKPRCRAITPSDLDAVAGLLTRGFSDSCRSYWTAGFARMRLLPEIEGLPRYGYLLDGGFGPVGVLLLIASRRGAQILCNTSSWYVDPAWRRHSTLLASAATKLKHVTYLNASPARHTISYGRSFHFARLKSGR